MNRARVLAGIGVVLVQVAWGTAPMAAQQDRLVVLVRHGEAGGAQQADPPLTERGYERARALAASVPADVGAVIVSELQRTRLTAQVVLDDLGLTATVIGVSGGLEHHVQAVAEAVRARPPGESVLVVGHSNTIPKILAALGGPTLDDLCHGEFARLFWLHLRADGSADLTERSYGEPDEAGAGAGACHTR